MRINPVVILALSLVLALTLVPDHAQGQIVNYYDLVDLSCGNQPNACYPNNPGIVAQGTDGNFYGMACDTYSPCNNAGIFQMSIVGGLANINVLSVLSNSTYTSGGLTLGPDGNFYGVTTYGGASNLGSVFRITPGGVLNTIYSFKGANDGQNPTAPPTVGDDGALYGIAVYAGYKITTAGAFTSLTSSIPYYQSSVNSGSVAPLSLASDGSFYGTVPSANANGGTVGGTVFRMSPGGAVTVLYNFQPDLSGNYTQGEYPYGGLVQGSDGNLYGTAAYGGANAATCSDCGVAYQIPTSGGQPTWEYSFNEDQNGWAPYAGLVAANDGNLYGVTSETGGNGSGQWGTFFSLSNTGQFTNLFILSANCSAGSCIGARPYATPMQATNGSFYGLTTDGGNWNQGVFYQLSVTGIGSFVTSIQPSGKSGDTIGILGQNLSSSSVVEFHGALATVSSVNSTGTYLTAKLPATATTGPITVDGVPSNHNFRVRLTTTTKLTTSGSPSYINQPVTFTATIIPKKGIVPDGELVIFQDGNAVIGTSTTTSGMAAFTTSSLSAKSHTIKATYEGDGSLVASTGNLAQVVQLYPTATTVTSSLNPSNYGQSVTLTAQVTSSAPNQPTGSVTFKSGSNSLGSATLSESTAVFSTTKMAVGTDSITVTYNGDSLNAKSTSTALMQTVNQAQITMKLASTPNPSTVGQSVKFTVTMTSNGGLPGGTVTFSYNNSTLGTANIVAGRATFSTITLPQGADEVTATYAGSINYSAASAFVVQQVN